MRHTLYRCHLLRYLIPAYPTANLLLRGSRHLSPFAAHYSTQRHAAHGPDDVADSSQRINDANSTNISNQNIQWRLVNLIKTDTDGAAIIDVLNSPSRTLDDLRVAYSALRSDDEYLNQHAHKIFPAFISAVEQALVSARAKSNRLAVSALLSALLSFHRFASVDDAHRLTAMFVDALTDKLPDSVHVDEDDVYVGIFNGLLSLFADRGAVASMQRLYDIVLFGVDRHGDMTVVVSARPILMPAETTFELLMRVHIGRRDIAAVKALLDDMQTLRCAPTMEMLIGALEYNMSRADDRNNGLTNELSELILSAVHRLRAPPNIRLFHVLLRATFKVKKPLAQERDTLNGHNLNEFDSASAHAADYDCDIDSRDYVQFALIWSALLPHCRRKPDALCYLILLTGYNKIVRAFVQRKQRVVDIQTLRNAIFKTNSFGAAHIVDDDDAEYAHLLLAHLHDIFILAADPQRFRLHSRIALLRIIQHNANALTSRLHINEQRTSMIERITAALDQAIHNQIHTFTNADTLSTQLRLIYAHALDGDYQNIQRFIHSAFAG